MRIQSRALGGVILATALAIAVTGCTKKAPDTTAASPSPSPTPTESAGPTETPPTPPEPTEEPTTTPAPSPVISDGKHFVYLRKIAIDGAAGAVTFDLAYFLTGQEAIDAADADGNLPPDGVLPNDYYIQNDNPKLRTMMLAPNGVKVRVLDWTNCCQLKNGNLIALADAIAKKDPTGEYAGKRSPYWITVAGGKIVKIEEQFLP